MHPANLYRRPVQRKRTLISLVILSLVFYLAPLSAQTNDFRGKVAIITGTSSGLGLELAKLAAKRDMRLVLVDIDLPPSRELADKINDQGGEAIAVEADLAEHSERVKAVEAARDRFGRVDYLFNNAGYIYSARLDQMDLQQAKRQFDVNYWAYADLAQQVIPMMKEQGGGTILNVSSILGLIPGGPGQGHYAASKKAIVGLFEAAAEELAPHNIKVFVAAPGGMRTNIARNAVGPLARQRQGRAGDWEEPEIPARDIFKGIQGDQVVFRPGYAGDVSLEDLRNR